MPPQGDDNAETSSDSPPDRGRLPIKVFLSYAHSHRDDAPDGVQQWQDDVFRLAYQLCRAGLDAEVDLFHVHDDDIDWSTFGPNEIASADYVLIVASKAYKERWEGVGDPTTGAGAAREANVLKAQFDQNRAHFQKRVKLVLLDGIDVADAPLELQASVQRFPIESFGLDGLGDLLRTLTGRRMWIKPQLGKPPPLPPRAILGMPPLSPQVTPTHDVHGSISPPPSLRPGPPGARDYSHTAANPLSDRLRTVRRELDAKPLSRRASFLPARRIRAAERDASLALSNAYWPGSISLPPDWNVDPSRLYRSIEASSILPVTLEESILRFPSAPFAGLQRVYEWHAPLNNPALYHTYRVLRSETARRVSRIFLLNAGLNERTSFGSHYQLAANLICEDPETVCIVRPFPEHLTRYPFQAFSESPLERYLWDGTHLLQQFMRFMIESRWFLSVLARRSVYRSAAGIGLVAPHETLGNSRVNTAVVSKTVLQEATELRDASERMLRPVAEWEDVPQRTERLGLEAVTHCVDSLRQVLNLDSEYPGQTGILRKDDREPAVHTVGFGFGGYTSQALLMGWPYLVSSSTSLVATSSTLPEEWDAVVHSLKQAPDLVLSLSGGHPSEESPIAASQSLRAFAQIFREIYLTNSPNALTSRLAAFRKRMLFVISGAETRQAVFRGPSSDASLNVLELSDVEDRDDSAALVDADERRAFWAEETAKLLGHFADRANEELLAERPQVWLDDRWLYSDTGEAALRVGGDSTSRSLSSEDMRKIAGKRKLDPYVAERMLGGLADREDGVLFVLSNELPTPLLAADAVLERAAALYHDDVSIARYCRMVYASSESVHRNAHSAGFVLPWNLQRLLRVLEPSSGLPSQSETVGPQPVDRVSADRKWGFFVAAVQQLIQTGGDDTVRIFDGRESLSSITRDSGAVDRLLAHASEFAGREALTSIPSLPDCWLWLSAEFLGMPSRKLTLTDAIAALPDAVVERGASREVWASELKRERIYVISQSRARFNPRYQGRVVDDPSSARRALVHSALCIALSRRWTSAEKSMQ